MATQFLGEFELTVLLAVLQVGEGAYAVSIREEIEGRGGRDASRGAVYVTLDRLEKKGYLSSSMSDPTPQRGGKAKRIYEIQPAGLEAIRESRDMLTAMWTGLDAVLEQG